MMADITAIKMLKISELPTLKSDEDRDDFGVG